MAKLLKRLNPEISVYKDRRFDGDEADWQRALRTSTTLYVGNLAFFTREEQIYEVFSKCGHVSRIIMGLDKLNKTPCGFCFVLFYSRSDAEAAVRYLNGTILDDRPIRVDHDWGFVEGRQWGRGKSGGQVRDEFRLDYDPGRGGFGKEVLTEMETQLRQTGGPGLSPGYGDGSRRNYERDMPSSKRQRMESGYGGGAVRDHGRAVEENPRFRDRKRDRDDDD